MDTHSYRVTHFIASLLLITTRLVKNSRKSWHNLLWFVLSTGEKKMEKKKQVDICVNGDLWTIRNSNKRKNPPWGKTFIFFAVHFCETSGVPFGAILKQYVCKCYGRCCHYPTIDDTILRLVPNGKEINLVWQWK